MLSTREEPLRIGCLMAKLILKSDGEIQEEVEVVGPSFVIGRDPECDLTINQPFLSRRHCQIVQRDGTYSLEDLKSLNGTLLNENPVTRSEIRGSDTIRIGKVELVFSSENERQGESTAELGAPRIEVDAELVLQEYSLHSRKVDGKRVTEPLTTATLSSGLSDPHRGAQLFFSLYQISKKLSQPTDLKQLVRVVMTSIFEVLKAERGILFLRDPQSRGFYAQVSYDRRNGFTEESPVGYSTSIVRRALDQHMATLTSDATTDPRFAGNESIILDNIRSVLCAPLWDHKVTHGAIYLESSSLSYAFTKEDQALLTGIANLLALRIKLEREERLRNSLGQYHSPDMVETLMANEGKLTTGRKEVTLLYADIRNSVGIAERLGEDGIHKLLHHFYEMSAEAVFKHGGHVNKYIGDAVLAVFNAPIEAENHEIRGLSAAFDLISRVRQFNLEREEWAFELRIGINTGPVIAGNIGPRKRLEYAVIGDTVNVCERLSRVETASGIVVAEACWQQVGDGFRGVFLEEIQVKGRQQKVRVYEALEVVGP